MARQTTTHDKDNDDDNEDDDTHADTYDNEGTTLFTEFFPKILLSNEVNLQDSKMITHLFLQSSAWKQPARAGYRV